MNFGTSDSITGHHIREATKSHSLEIGLYGSLLYNNLRYLSECTITYWITHS